MNAWLVKEIEEEEKKEETQRPREWRVLEKMDQRDWWFPLSVMVV